MKLYYEWGIRQINKCGEELCGDSIAVSRQSSAHTPCRCPRPDPAQRITGRLVDGRQQFSCSIALRRIIAICVERMDLKLVSQPFKTEQFLGNKALNPFWKIWHQHLYPPRWRGVNPIA